MLKLPPVPIVPEKNPTLLGPPKVANNFSKDILSSDGSLPGVFSERTESSCTTIKTTNTPARHNPDPLMNKFYDKKGKHQPPLHPPSPKPAPPTTNGKSNDGTNPTKPTTPSPRPAIPEKPVESPPSTSPPDSLVDTPPSTPPSQQTDTDDGDSSSSSSSSSYGTSINPVKFGNDAPSTYEFYTLKKKVKYPKKNMNSMQHDMMNLTSENRKKKQEHILERNNDNAGLNNLHKGVTAVGPD